VTANRLLNSLQSKALAAILLISLFCRCSFAGPPDEHPNQITIRSDRVFLLNGKPFFPIGVCFELGDSAYNKELRKPGGTGTYGFNFINLFAQNANLYNCFNSKNVISGDMFSGSQYADILHAYWNTALTVQANYDRIVSYLDPGVYLLADEIAFRPDDITHWEWRNYSPCNDSIVMNPPFTQQARNSAINRVNSLALQNGSRIIGFYSMDDANLFQAQGPEPPIWYYNNYRNQRIVNFEDTYIYAKSVYGNSIVLMSLPPVFFPRIFDFNNWQNVSIARDAWVNDALEFTKGANVIFAPGYISMENWAESFRIYETGQPRWYERHIKETIIERVLSKSPEPKAALGGILFDIWDSNPAYNDPKLETKVKWEMYSGLQQGATGLIFFGWHKLYEKSIDTLVAQGINFRPIWDAIRRQVDTLVNVKHLDSVFEKTNFGSLGYTVSSADTGTDVSYAIYKNESSDWSDYYMLVTNNPRGSVAGPDEGSKNFTFTCNTHSLDNYRITEVFSARNVSNSGGNTFTYSLPWFGTSMFHITNRSGGGNIPESFYLKQNYPNPFNPVTNIGFGLKSAGPVNIRVYDVIGRVVRTLVNEYRNAGEYITVFDGTNLASGTYFCKMNSGGFEQTRAMLLVK
jgi:hypothetical protein